MTLTFYRLIAAPSMVFSLLLLSPFNRKLRGVLRMKLQKRFPPPLTERPIWVHAASGEFEYAKSVIREIKREHPNVPVVVTYSSISFVKAIESFPGVDFSLPLPLDLPGPTAAFLKKYNPKAALIARTDLWPEMLAQTKKRGIPIVLFSYTQRPLKEMSWLARKARGWLLSLVDEIRCVTPEDAANLKELGVTDKITVEGDTRYDQVRYRLEHPKALPSALKPVRPALVAGSTWSEDEAILLPALTDILKDKKMQLILVPHEPTPAHIGHLERQCQDAGLTHSKFSSEQDWSDCDVLLVDRIGVLAELYQWGDFAFVGGSYRGSVHSVMEPLGAGLLTLVGPYHLNNREAIEFSKIPVGPFHAVQVCTNEDAFRKTCELLVGGDKSARREEILKAFGSRLGASLRLSERIFDRRSVNPAGDSSTRTIHS